LKLESAARLAAACQEKDLRLMGLIDHSLRMLETSAGRPFYSRSFNRHRTHR
jgi:hypothetical protein